MPKEETTGLETFFTELLQRINDIENRTKANKNKIDLLASSLISRSKKSEEEIAIMRDNIKKIEEELEKIKQKVDYFLAEMPNLVRKEDISSIEKFISLWQPLKFVTIEDVERMIKKIEKQ